MTKLLIFIRTYWIVVTLIMLTGITVLSLLPLKDLPPLPGNDKIQHLIAYALLMFPVSLHKPNSLLFAGLFFIMWSGAIELLQPLVNRYREWGDLAANSIGIGCGFLSGRLAVLLLPKKQ